MNKGFSSKNTIVILFFYANKKNDYSIFQLLLRLKFLGKDKYFNN